MHPEQATSMSRRRKAALIVQMIIGSGERVSLSDLPEAMQETLTHELGALRLVDRKTVEAVTNEFTRELESIGLIPPGSTDKALNALADHLSPELANKLRAQLAGGRDSDPWTALFGLETDVMVRMMTEQCLEVCAIALSKLPVAKAAALLGLLPGERARAITYAMSQTADVAPDVVRRIGTALVSDYCHKQVVAFDRPADKRLGAILNSTTAQTRDDMLEGLVETDVVFASDVRKSIFTFKDIPARLNPVDIPNCTRGVDQDVLTTAIAAALASDAEFVAAAEFILANISQRMAGTIREEAAEKGTVRKADGETAMSAVTASIRDLVDAGTINLIVLAEEIEETA